MVAATVSVPVLAIVEALSTKTRSVAATLGPGFATNSAAVRVMDPLVAVMVMVRLLRSVPMPMAAVKVPLLPVVDALGVITALLLTAMVTGAPATALRLESSAKTVAVTESLPVLAMVETLSTTTKSATELVLGPIKGVPEFPPPPPQAASAASKRTDRKCFKWFIAVFP